jgi:hypothetical protein
LQLRADREPARSYRRGRPLDSIPCPSDLHQTTSTEPGTTATPVPNFAKYPGWREGSDYRLAGKAESVDDRGVAHRCPRGRKESARTTVRRPGSLRGAATVMVGFAAASGTSAPSPVYAPRSDRVRPLTPAGGPGSSSLREQGRALLRSGAEQSWSCLHDGLGAGIASGLGRCPVGIGEEWHQQLGQRLDGVLLLISGEVDEGGRGQVDVTTASR